MRKSLLLLLFPLCLVSCGGGTNQDDYDALQAKCNQLEKEANDYKSQLSSCQSELADYKEKCEDLQEQIGNQSSSNDVPTRVIERTVVGSNAKQILVIAKNDVKNLYNDVLYGNVNGTDDLLRRIEAILSYMDDNS